MKSRFLLVDDHTMFRAGLRSLLQSRYPGLEIIEAGDGATAIKLAGEMKPEIVVMDLHLPDANGLDVSQEILAMLPGTKVIVMSGDLNLSYVNQAIKIGVSAYLLKTSAPAELPVALNAVLAGKLYLCPEANTAALEGYRQALTTSAPAKALLSSREREVLLLIVEGLRTKEVAARLEVGVKSIETYRRRLMKKLSCGSTAELVRYAMREGIIQP